jgi:hypothetical protein
MVAETFGINLDEEFADSIVGIQEGKVITTLEIALAASRVMLPAERYDIRFCSTSPGFNEEHLKLNFYQKFNAATVERSGPSSLFACGV